jgi:hypothetical protein
MNRHPLEELFRGSRKTLRVLRVLLTAREPLTKYAIENRAAVYDAGPLLDRLARIGVVKVVEGRPRRYSLDPSSPLVGAVEKLMRETGYL